MKMEDIVNYCKTYGFLYQGSQIYGGLANAWDYGPLGVELKNNIQRAWWKKFIQESRYNVGLDSAILMNPKVWEASGHVAGFNDPMMDCKQCQSRYRADHLIEEQSDENPADWTKAEMSDYIKDHHIKCPNCGAEDFSDIKEFALMFKTQQGVIAGEGDDLYLRPETVQGIFVNYKNILRTSRKKVPFGIGQVGKSFRNEITPGNFIFRTREFEQMELAFFTKPGTDEEWFKYWQEQAVAWLKFYGLKEDNFTLRVHDKKELSHYSKGTVDIEYKYPFGQSELWGIANRTDFDLKAHQKASGENMEYLDPSDQKRYIPYVIEPSLGLNRMLLAFLCDALTEEKDRLVLKIHNDLAPYKICILPLQKQQVEQAEAIFADLASEYMLDFDQAGTIGKRYKRQDAIGTPYCLTVDFDTAEDDAVTIRHRDSMEQDRIKITDLKEYFHDKFNM